VIKEYLLEELPGRNGRGSFRDDHWRGWIGAESSSVAGIAVIPQIFGEEQVFAGLEVFQFEVVVRERLGWVRLHILVFASLRIEFSQCHKRAWVASILDTASFPPQVLLRESESEFILALYLPDLKLKERWRKMREGGFSKIIVGIIVYLAKVYQLEVG
jgi:hypothetical protein